MELLRHHNHWLARWWWTVDRWMLGGIMALLAIGIILVSAGSPAVASRIGLDGFHFVHRHYVFIAMSLTLLLGASMLSPALLRKLSLLGLAGCFLFMMALPFIGFENKGATRWLMLGPLSVQPSEFMKPLLAVVAAWMLALRQRVPGFPSIRLTLALYVMALFLLIIQPDFGMSVVVAVMGGVQLFLAGMPWVWVLVLLGAALLGGVGAYEMLPHVRSRIDRFLDPSTGDSYQVDRSLEAIKNGGFLGKGLGEGTVKHHLPDAHTDFIFSVGGEEFGLWFTLLMVTIFAFLLLRGLWRLLDQQDLFHVLAVAGLLTVFGLQSVINMGVAIGLLPAKGMTLPFISYGGSSLMAMALTMGMVLSLLRRRYGQLRDAGMG